MLNRAQLFDDHFAAYRVDDPNTAIAIGTTPGEAFAAAKEKTEADFEIREISAAERERLERLLSQGGS
jgi:hypothetical protein